MTTKMMTATIGPKIKTALPGPNAKRVLEGDEKYISPSYTRSYPLVAKSGRGIVVTDVDGNEFFDFSAGIAVTSTGHCHPDVVAAIQRQVATPPDDRRPDRPEERRRLPVLHTIIFGQQRLHLAPQRIIAGTGLVQKSRPLAGNAFPGGVIQLLNSL